MEKNNSIKKSTDFYGSNSSDNKSELFNTNIEVIYRDYSYNHYFCTKCYKFPFLKFCKDRKNVKLTCSCFNNKKISIEELFKNIAIENSLLRFLSETNLNIENNEDKLKCKEHNKEFKGFSKFLLNNFCEECDDYMNEINDNDIIRYNDIKIEENKIEELKRKVNDNNDIFDNNNDISENTIKFNINNDGNYEEISKDEEKNFKKLINIIINDYLELPNFIHFINIKNLLYFFKIEDKLIEKEGNIIDDNFIDKKEPIIIEYINNISKKIKLFSKVFVKNNKEKFEIEIEGRKLDLIEEYEFKTKEKTVRIKLFKKKNVSEINMYKMFSDCINLIYVNGISKIKKIINIDKIFYNCINLSFIPDIKDWEIKNGYLMFYNCISFIFFPYEREIKIDKYDEGLLGILITKYLKYNKEIIISNIKGDNEGNINLFKNRFKIKDKSEEIMILDGKDDKDLHPLNNQLKFVVLFIFHFVKSNSSLSIILLVSFNLSIINIFIFISLSKLLS